MRAARDLFYAHGISNVGIDAVIERAGVAKMSLYAHFKGKDELISAVLRSREREVREWLEEIVGKRAGPEERILAVFDAFAEVCAGVGFKGCPFLCAIAQLADSEHPGHAVAVEYKAWFGGWIEHFVREAGVDDPELTARQITMLVDGQLAAGAIHAGDQREIARASAGARAAAAELLRAAITRRGAQSSCKPSAP